MVDKPAAAAVVEADSSVAVADRRWILIAIESDSNCCSVWYMYSRHVSIRWCLLRRPHLDFLFERSYFCY